MTTLERGAPVHLAFHEPVEDPGEPAEPVSDNLSAAAIHGDQLWVANDETARLERLLRQGDDRWAGHEVFRVGDYVDLPDEGEMDIEGLDVDGGYLWVVGSHSATRKKPKPDENGAEAVLARLAEVSWDANRWFLGRLALDGQGNGAGLARKVKDGTRKRHSACLPIRKKKGTALVRALADDEHVGRFMGLPAKENGFDVEGLAVRGERVFLGLRGPVLRGWAMILELRLAQGDDPDELVLAPVGPDGALVRKHFFELDGLGIRELTWQGDDLLILAGPTMDLDGPVRIWRWRGPLHNDGPVVLRARDLELVTDVPFGHGDDHAEGLFIADAGTARQRLMVIYDSPAERRRQPGGIEIDSFILPDPQHAGTARRSRRKAATPVAADGAAGSVRPEDLIAEGPVRTGHAS